MFTKKLTQFVVGTNYGDLPREVVEATKAAILDYVGVAMAGSQETSGKIICEVVKENRSIPEATVIGGRFKASCSMAALANGTSGHVLDYDDCLDFPEAGLAHPSTTILPAALAIGEKMHIPGKDLIIAYCLGIEAYAKAGLLTKEAFKGSGGWEWTGVLGGIGATAAVSKLLKLDEHKTRMAFGTVVSTSGGLIRNFGTMAGHLHSGSAARSGLEAALLARNGFSSCDDIFEISGGFYNTFTGNQSPVAEEAMQKQIEGLGNPWNIINPGLMFKSFPCAHISHFGVDAALRLRKKYSIDWQQIEEIEFRIPRMIQRAVSYQDPQTGVEGKFSLGYCLCRALVKGKIQIGDFSDESVKDPVTRKLMSKIKWATMEQHPQEGPFGSQEVVLKMKDGSVYSCRVDHPRGEPQNPQTKEEFESKYTENALYARYDKKSASQIKDLILDLENREDVSQITELIGK